MDLSSGGQAGPGAEAGKPDQRGGSAPLAASHPAARLATRYGSAAAQTSALSPIQEESMVTTRVGRRSATVALAVLAASALGCGLFGGEGGDLGDDYNYATTAPPQQPGGTAPPTDPPAPDPPAAAIEVAPLAEPGRTSLRITGSGFGADDVIGLTLDGQAAGVARADANGSFTTLIRLPGGDATQRTVRATGTPSTRTATARVTA
jgi:hypothetical protein